jgi:hypothetical protein
MAEELDEYTKCVIVGGKTTPLQLSESELGELFESRAFKNLRRQACKHVGVLMTRLCDDKLSESELRVAQGEFRALRWLINSKSRLVKEFQAQQQTKEQRTETRGEASLNEQRLDTLLEGYKHGEE